MILSEWLAQAQARIDRVDARAIARHVLQLTRTQLITQTDRVITENEYTLLSTCLIANINHHPIAYITGSKEFYGLDFRVTVAVLVPRPETELLVDLALTFLKVRPDAKLLDLGTGSGCIAISIAHHAAHASVTALDVSPAALEIAAHNNARHAQGRVRLLRSDWFSAVKGERFDLILSNPPYIAEGDAHLDALKAEPITALTSGGDGLDAIRHIASLAPAHLEPQGQLWLEHGYDQAAAVRALLSQAALENVASRLDLSGIERISGGQHR